jgi:peptidoglycan hydrolase CwlO-like protein
MIRLSYRPVQIFVVLALLLVCLPKTQLYADPTPTVTPTPTGTTSSSDSSQSYSDLQNKIKDLESKVSDLQSQEKTLSSQITVMDSQMKLTQYRIDATKDQIDQLTNDISVASKKINNLEGSISDISKVLISRIVATYQVGTIQPLQILLSSGTVSDFLQRANYLRIAQAHDKKLIYDTEQARNDYQNQKDIFQQKKQQVLALQTQLEDYTKQLDQEKSDKQRLLSDTQGSEANYQSLLARAQAQLAGFSRFTSSQGGTSLLGNQTVCDDWGCYYNQRDSQWGGIALNNTQYSIASDGCLMTAMAMVYTHYGHRSVTPLTINSNPGNFASYEPAWLNKTITADGTTASRISSQIDSELSSGKPVIVGISYDGGPYPDHFVVLISGSGGSYNMNDPYTPNGHNIPFSSHYSVGSIREIDRISI